MKKVTVVSKTHLDLGFTDYAGNIRKKYIDEFIPGAVQTAQKLNAGKRRFVWTTGSWVIKEALRDSSPENREKLIQALKDGDIAPHAMPFTTHTELLDADTIDYGLSIVNEIDAITGRKTVAAKMTDVPGHTAALVPLLAKHGIKLLHIGVNGASAMPDVAQCFLWRHDGAEIMVIYSGAYGGEYSCKITGDVLYFDHTLDNHGARNSEAVRKNFERICKKYPGYAVEAGRIDDFADSLWEHREQLPVLEGEIGDSWIHGAAADPYKTAALRELTALKNSWISDGSLIHGSDEYKAFADCLLCIAEHTWGLDMKMYLADYENYLREDFERARKADAVDLKHPLRGWPQNIFTLFLRRRGVYKPGSYSAMEKSWQEQRGYICSAVEALAPERRALAQRAVDALRPESPQTLRGELIRVNEVYHAAGNSLAVNLSGGIKHLTIGGKTVIAENDGAAVQYHSYGKADYDFWLSHYTRDIEKTKKWALGDFARPLIEYVDDQYPHGRFSYSLKSGSVEAADGVVRISVNLGIDEVCRSKLGAASGCTIVYVLSEKGLDIDLSWFDKPANRLTESTIFRLYPNTSESCIKYRKSGSVIDPLSVVNNGNRNLSAVESIEFEADGGVFEIINRHAPLAGIGRGKIPEFDNKFENAGTEGVSFILHNNFWGTNFPLWYEDNAHFKFTIKQK